MAVDREIGVANTIRRVEQIGFVSRNVDQDIRLFFVAAPMFCCCITAALIIKAVPDHMETYPAWLK